MAPTESDPPPKRYGSATFATTHWSVILTAAQENHPDSIAAMDSLCRTYWKPLHAFVLRAGWPPDSAEDMVQAFFAHLIGKDLVKRVEVEGGKFRSFLLVSLKNFLNSQREHARAQKRGGGQCLVPLSSPDLEVADPANTPDKEFDRVWALTVLREAMDLLEADYDRAERRPILAQLRGFLAGDRTPVTYGQVAEQLGTSEGAVKMMVQRMRRRYRECLYLVVARTVVGQDQVEQELRHLVETLSS